MKQITPAAALVRLAGYAIAIGASNSHKLVGETPPAQQLSYAIKEAQQPGNEKFSRGFHHELQSVCVAMGDNVIDHDLAGASPWLHADKIYLSKIYRRASDARVRARSSAGCRAHEPDRAAA